MNKLVGLGKRYFLENGFYWGWGITFGRYLFAENDLFYDCLDRLYMFMDNDDEVIFGIEFLKFGWAF